MSTNQRITLFGLCVWTLATLYFVYELFIRVSLGTIATNFISDLDINAAEFALIGTAFYIAYSSMQIPVGIIADKFIQLILDPIKSMLENFHLFAANYFPIKPVPYITDTVSHGFTRRSRVKFV